jgi:hypothetical protein
MADFKELSGLQKDVHILTMLANLRQRLGPGAFRVVDHWDADLRAVGIAHPRNEHILAYIADVDAEGRFYVELEISAPAGSQVPYSVAGRHRSVSFDELVTLVAEHFRSAALDTSR